MSWLRRPAKGSLFNFFTFGVAALGLWGCQPGGAQVAVSTQELAQSCGIPSDQSASLMAPISTFPIQVAVDNEFDANEQQELFEAVNEWNALGHQYGKGDLFRVTVRSIPSQLRTSNPHNCQDNLGSNDFSFSILRERSASHWESMGFNSSIPGATIRCEAGGVLDHQIIFIEPKYATPQQLAQVFVHELGHSLGLDHSCLEGVGTPNYRGCTGLDSSHPYRLAVMYPWLSKRAAKSSSNAAGAESVIQLNDKVRANCIMSQQQ